MDCVNVCGWGKFEMEREGEGDYVYQRGGEQQLWKVDGSVHKQSFSLFPKLDQWIFLTLGSPPEE